MAEDSNRWGEEERRRRVFTGWLTRVWEWAAGEGMDALAAKVAELLAHGDEEDYPLWEMAKQIGVLRRGPGQEDKLTEAIRTSCGVPLEGPRPDGWERQIHFSPAIRLEEKLWQQIYDSLGWANRNTDTSVAARNFYLWSPQGNVIRFLVREPVKVEQDDGVG